MADDTKVDYTGLTAADVLAPNAHTEVDDEARERAVDAGVVDAAYVDYEEALKAYEARPDIETLEGRRARENGTAFSEANYVREAENPELAADKKLLSGKVAGVGAEPKPTTQDSPKAKEQK
jgi:hypothetical protein